MPVRRRARHKRLAGQPRDAPLRLCFGLPAGGLGMVFDEEAIQKPGLHLAGGFAAGGWHGQRAGQLRAFAMKTVHLSGLAGAAAGLRRWRGPAASHWRKTGSWQKGGSERVHDAAKSSLQKIVTPMLFGCRLLRH